MEAKKEKQFSEKRGLIIALMKSRGFGFITQEDGEDIFFNATGVCDPSYDDLKEGFKVKYLVVKTPRGPKAIGITRI